MPLARLFIPPLAACCVLSAMAGVAWAGDANRITVLEENDSLFSKSDKHYTQGLRLSDLGSAIEPHSGLNGLFDLAGRIAPVFARDGSPPEDAATAHPRRTALFLGQNIFTPTNLGTRPPDPSDRPYGGWLGIGASLLQDSDRHMLENLEITIGVVGPGAFAKQVQNDFHQFIGVPPANGWSKEIQTEPGVMLTYERLWHVPVVGGGNNGIDIVPQLGATVGNVFTYGDAGALLRIGKNLQADYGPARIRPALSGTDYFDGDHLDGKFGFYVFLGAQGRVVGRNIFLDGNSFRQSPSVDKKALVGDLQAGLSMFWSKDWRADVSTVHRTREFDGQQSPDVIGTATITFSL